MTYFWYPHDEGLMVGKAGSEGIVVYDEEYAGGARITLERDCIYNGAFAVTCSIYGWMTHICRLADEWEAYDAYETIKMELAEIIEILPNQDDPEAEAGIDLAYDYIKDFVGRWQTGD
ncbi:MAG: hypothetical protein JXB07_20005 [Anaerolineae bacterium]|nr:hypothetical protein [Anaerolineae bacterium]